MTRTHRFFEPGPPLALAHQGGGKEAVENSSAAFANAHRLGYRHLDIDLQVTSDGIVVAHHDDTLERLTGLTGAIADRTWKELSEARLPNDEAVALFDELCETYPDAYWNIELKSDQAIRPTLEMIGDRNLGSRTCLSTFYDVRMWKLRRSAAGLGTAASTPRFATLWLKVASYVRVVPFRAVAHVSQAPVTQIGITVLDERFVARAHEAGMAVIAWTIDEPREMHRLLDLGVDGINSDVPTTLKSVLEERDEWASL